MTFWRHPHNWQCKVSILLPLFGTIARIILLLILAFIKKFFSKKLFVDFKILKIYKVFELIYKTGRSSIKKFLSGCILTRVWISWGRPGNKQHQRHKIFIKQYKFFFEPVAPGASSSGVEAELSHSVHGGNGVIPPVPPPPRQNTCKGKTWVIHFLLFCKV